MVEVGVDNPKIVQFMQKMEDAMNDHVDNLTLAEMVGAIEIIKQSFILANIGEDIQLH